MPGRASTTFQAFDASVDGKRCVSPVNFRTVKPGLRENAKLVEHLLVGILFGPIRQVITPLRLSDAVLRHEGQLGKGCARAAPLISRLRDTAAQPLRFES